MPFPRAVYYFRPLCKPIRLLASAKVACPYIEHFIDDPLLPGGDFFDTSTMATHDVGQDYVQHDTDRPDGKVSPTEFQEDVPGVPASKHQPPPYVKSLSAEQRHIAERALVRKIDLRLLPMIILMYV